MTTLKVVQWEVRCALTGDKLSHPQLTEPAAEVLCNKLKKKHPTAFVQRIDP